MPAHQQTQYLVCYDISDPKRLQRVHRALKKTGIPVQYSVFSLVMTKTKLRAVLQQIEMLIDDKQDDVRCYTLPKTIDCKTLGRQFFPQDVMLFTKGVSSLIDLR